MPSVTGSLPTTCIVFGQLIGATGGFLSNAEVSVELEAPFEENGYIIPAFRNTVMTGASGEWQVPLIPHDYDFRIKFQAGNVSFNRKFPGVTVPDQANANFADLVEL